MKRYDLFVDESGAFRKEQESLIGGFLCESGAIRSFDCQNTLKNIKEALTNEISLRDNLPNMDFYIWEHCCENKMGHASSYREEIQYRVLQHYMDFLKAKQAKPVIFLNDAKEMFTDSTTTYLSVFAKGILLLLKQLHRYDEEVVLKIFVAQRMDTTARRLDEENITNLSEAIFELGADNRTILKAQYRKTFEWFFKIVLDSETYIKWKIDRMISEMEIMEDAHSYTRGKWVTKPNDYTVICDYICNSYFARKGVFRSSERYHQVLDFYSESVYKATSKNAVFTPEDITVMLEQNRISAAFELVCLNENFEFNTIKIVLLRINRLEANEGLVVIENAMDSLKKVITDTSQNTANQRLLNRILDYGKLLENELHKIIFEINVRIYLMAVLSHLSINEQFHSNFVRSAELLDRITEVSLFEKYSDLLYNRRMVFLTDCFDYDGCEALFSNIDSYYQSKLKLYDGRSLKSVSYGRIIGSYVQMLAMRIRLAQTEEDRDFLVKYAEYYAKLAIEQFDAPDDMARAYQNYCIEEIAAGRYKQALTYLQWSLKDIPEGVHLCKNILSKIKKWETGAQYKLYLYIKIMSESLLYGSDHEENRRLSSEMYQCLVSSGINCWDEQKLKYYPRHVILWKLASYYAQNGKKKEALRHYKASYSLLTSNEYEYTMQMMSLAVLAEEIYMLMTRIEEVELEQELKLKFSEKFKLVMEHKPDYVINVFGTASVNGMKSAEDYFEFSKKVAY